MQAIGFGCVVHRTNCDGKWRPAQLNFNIIHFFLWDKMNNVRLVLQLMTVAIPYLWLYKLRRKVQAVNCNGRSHLQVNLELLCVHIKYL